MCAVTIIAVTQPDTINSSVRARARGVREAMHDLRGDTTVPLAACKNNPGINHRWNGRTRLDHRLPGRSGDKSRVPVVPTL
jgi:hypothetical protein